MARIENWNPPSLNSNNAIFNWTAEYAALVHEGDFERNYPARPWVDNAVAQIDFETDFANKYKATEDLNESFSYIVEVLKEQTETEMLEPQFYWPRFTTRKSGEVVGSPRDIYDLGTLYNSLTVAMEVRS